MKRAAVFMLLAIFCCDARETRSFFGNWSPPDSLAEFWKPVDESWWHKGTTLKLDRHCREFAKHSKPELIIPDMIADLKTNPSEVRSVVYVDVMLNWPQQQVLRILSPYYHSRDPEIANIAKDFWADVEPQDVPNAKSKSKRH